MGSQSGWNGLRAVALGLVAFIATPAPAQETAQWRDAIYEPFVDVLNGRAEECGVMFQHAMMTERGQVAVTGVVTVRFLGDQGAYGIVRMGATRDGRTGLPVSSLAMTVDGRTYDVFEDVGRIDGAMPLLELITVQHAPRHIALPLGFLRGGTVRFRLEGEAQEISLRFPGARASSEPASTQEAQIVVDASLKDEVNACLLLGAHQMSVPDAE